MMYKIFAFYWKWACIAGGGVLTYEIVKGFFDIVKLFFECFMAKSKLDALSSKIGNLSSEVSDLGNKEVALRTQLVDLSFKHSVTSAQGIDLLKKNLELDERLNRMEKDLGKFEGG